MAPRAGPGGPPLVRRAVRLGDGFLVGGRGPAYGREAVPLVRKLAAEAGRDVKTFPIAAGMYGHFDSNRDRAARTMADYIQAYYGRLIFDPPAGSIVGGVPEAVARIKEYAALDIDTLLIVPISRDPEQVDRLAEAVAAFRQSQ